MRKQQTVAVLNRICTKDYKVLATNIVIEKGTPILILIAALHQYENYFPELNKFKPERFSGKNTIPPMCFLPFGKGHRNCIAMRLTKSKRKSV